MLTILCGDDTAASRKKFYELKQEYMAKGYDIVAGSSENIEQLPSEFAFESTLFSTKRAFLLENVLAKKALRDAVLASIAGTGQSTPEVAIWDEAADDRVIKKAFPKAKTLVFKLPQTVWKFLDGLYPCNLQQSLTTLNAIKQTTDIHLTHYMMMRRVKELLILALGGQLPKLASWQVTKLKQQVRSWQPSQLENFFKKLVEIEMQTKNGTMVYSLDKALEIALCFYL